jgi:hypothetical protein
MDFNAGRYQEGTPMPALGRELFDLTLGVAGGARSIGEKAGHAQVSIWRNWSQAGPTDVGRFHHGPRPGRCVGMSPLASARATVAAAVAAAGSAPVPFAGYVVPRPGGKAGSTVAIERIGLILPTSLCSGEVARKIVGKLNGLVAAAGGGGNGVSGDDAAVASDLAAAVARFDCLPHTEGCGTGEFGSPAWRWRVEGCAYCAAAPSRRCPTRPNCKPLFPCPSQPIVAAAPCRLPRRRHRAVQPPDAGTPDAPVHR